MAVELLTGDEVAKLLRVSREMVYRIAARGDFPGRKVGRVWRFSKKAIEQYVDEVVPRPDSLFKRHPSKHSIKGKGQIAGWNNEFLMEVLAV